MDLVRAVWLSLALLPRANVSSRMLGQVPLLVEQQINDKRYRFSSAFCTIAVRAELCEGLKEHRTPLYQKTNTHIARHRDHSARHLALE